ncbi:MAG: L-2-amino-thiazoline-4-carboxylic acid hydrolase [Oscillospiraceae bacterium]
MSKIKNEWATQSREAMLYRFVLASSAEKNALNALEFEKRGIPYEDVYRCTSCQLAEANAKKFKSHMENPDDLRDWGKQLSPELGRETFGMEVLESTEDCFSMDMHFCPHLKGWQDVGLSDEMCAKLCDLAMEGDKAMAKAMDYDFENPMRLADGDCVCRVAYRRKNKQK